MTGQETDKIYKCYRIGDPRGAYPIFDATGSTINPGRWNTASNPIIYTSEHYSTALLEKLVHGSGSIPANQHYIEIIIPTGVSYEVFNTNALSSRGWDDIYPTVSKAVGDSWCFSKRSLLLFAPSVVARYDENILINPYHPDFYKIPTQGSISRHSPVYWDARLYGRTLSP